MVGVTRKSLNTRQVAGGMMTEARRALGKVKVVGAVAFGAMAIGALAVGAMTVRRLKILEARIERLSIGTLVVDRLEVRARESGV
jgi:hypothetical protein